MQSIYHLMSGRIGVRCVYIYDPAAVPWGYASALLLPGIRSVLSVRCMGWLFWLVLSGEYTRYVTRRVIVWELDYWCYLSLCLALQWRGSSLFAEE